MGRIVSGVWGWIERRGPTRGYHVLWLGVGAAVCAMAVGAAAQDSQRGAVEHFIGTHRPPDGNRLSPHESRRPARPRSLPCVSVRETRRSGTALRRWCSGDDRVPDGRRLRDTNLTQFAPDVMSGLYLPMFMFTGDYEINFDPTERLYRARVPALFRNALDPGQYPYPFWHDAKKWADYQAANEVTLWVDPAKVKVVIMQFSARGKPDPRLTSVPRTPPAFDGKWMWTDANGQIQPRPTLFVGLMRSNNPYLGQLEGAFKDLAGELRKGTCHECHAPDNSIGMKRLVLMQTPAHAAGEIKRIMRRCARTRCRSTMPDSTRRWTRPSRRRCSSMARPSSRWSTPRASGKPRTRDGTGSVGDVNDPSQREELPMMRRARVVGIAVATALVACLLSLALAPRRCRQRGRPVERDDHEVHRRRTARTPSCRRAPSRWCRGRSTTR